jgi:acetyltransferase-like isoleucine patch superfamily enzyme
MRTKLLSYFSFLTIPFRGIVKVFNYTKYILKSSEKEKPLAAVVYVLSEMLDIVISLFQTTMLGWKGSYLGRGSRILGTKGISVGTSLSVKRNAWIEAVFVYNTQRFSPVIKIGNNFSASDRLHISAINRIEIGDNCLFGGGVYISDHNHGVYRGAEHSSPFEPPIRRKLLSFGSVNIGDNVWLGDNVVIVGSVKIGSGSVIGANSVVTKDVPEDAIATGAPARVVKIFNKKNGIWERVTH